MKMRLTNKVRIKVEPGTPAPKRVKILQCSFDRGWYKESIGEVFEVDNASPPDDFTVWEDIINEAVALRHISQQDCEQVNP